MPELGAATFKTHPWSLEFCMKMLERQRIVLPEFQRSFVWKPSDIDLLLTSLAQSYPAGTLLFLKRDSTTDLAWRPVEGVDRNDRTDPDYLVLDGQQRLTSLYHAFYGLGDHFFFMDLKRPIEQNDDLESRIYPIRRSDAKRRGLLHKEEQWNSHQYPLSQTFRDDDWFEDYLEYHVARGGDRGSLRTSSKTFVKTYVAALRGYEFPVVELPPTTTLDAVCQIFESLNNTGMKLTVFDLLAARFWPKGLQLRELLVRARDEYELLREDEFDVDATSLLQAISLLRKGACRRSDLLELSADDFSNDWARVTRAAAAALLMLRSECGVLARDWTPYTSLFPALFATVARFDELRGPAVGAAWNKITRWFWCSCFGQRYEGPINTLNATDFRELWEWIQGGAVPEAVSGFDLYRVDLRGAQRQRNAVYRAVMCLAVVKQARDFHTGQPLTSDALRDPHRRIEDHHIVPLGFLRRSKSPLLDVANSILNRALIDQETNRLIADRAPSEYLRAIEDKLGRESLSEVLGSHLMPPEAIAALQRDEFEAFIDARADAVMRAISDITETELSGGTVPKAYLSPSTPFSNKLQLTRLLGSLRGRLFWYEQHMPGKVLEVLTEATLDHVTRISLLSGPTTVSSAAKNFERFATEMGNRGIRCEWKVLTKETSQRHHARSLFDDEKSYEVPPLNSILGGTVDAIHPSRIPRSVWTDLWDASEARPLIEYAREEGLRSASPTTSPAGQPPTVDSNPSGVRVVETARHGPTDQGAAATGTRKAGGAKALNAPEVELERAIQKSSLQVQEIATRLGEWAEAYSLSLALSSTGKTMELLVRPGHALARMTLKTGGIHFRFRPLLEAGQASEANRFSREIARVFQVSPRGDQAAKVGPKVVLNYWQDFVREVRDPYTEAMRAVMGAEHSDESASGRS